MDKKALKLALIQQITSCEDEQVLLTISKILGQLSSTAATSVNDPLMEALLRSGKTTPTSPVSDQDIADLQQSIDDIFGS
jgi:hypothetical protein